MNGLLLFPSRRPLTALLVASCLTLMAIAGSTRLVFDASLDSMFPSNDPAADSMVRILNRFSTADELLVLVTLPSDADKPDPDRLLNFAQRLEKTIHSGPAANDVGNIIYHVEPDSEQFVEKELAPAGLFYLTDAELTSVWQRLSSAGMQAQLAHDQATMSQPGPAASAMAKAFLQDPLSLHEFLIPHLTGAAPFATYQNSGNLISADGRALLIRILGKQPPTDLEYSNLLSNEIQQAVDASAPQGLHVALGGAYPIAALSQRSIRRDAIESVFGSVLLLLALFCIVYRRPIGLFHLAFGPVVIGTLWGFGAYGAALQNLSPIAAVIGGVLAAMGIDYSVLYLTRYNSLRSEGAPAKEAASRAITEIGAAVFAAFVTSVAGFLAIGASSVRALRDFSILGTLGLSGSFLAVLFVLPALLVLFDQNKKTRERSVFRFQMQPLVSWVGRHRRAFPIAGAVAAIVGLLIAISPGAGLLAPESDLTVMHPHPNAALDAEAEIANRFGLGAGTVLVHLQADDEDQLISLSHRVKERLSDPSVKSSGIAAVYGLADWLPDPAIVAARSASIPAGKADQVVADFKSAVDQSAFDATAMAPYGQFLHTLISNRTPPNIRTLRQFPSLSRDLLPVDSLTSPPEAVTVVFLKGSGESRDERDKALLSIQTALKGLQGATLTGLPVISRDAEQAVWQELPRLLWVAAGLVTAYLFLHFRNLRDVALSLLPAVFGMATLAAIVRLAGLHLNMINLVALPLLIGIDVDYGIYLVSLSRRGSAVASGAHAVLVCAISMIAGYASLFTASVPAIQSLGLIVAAGVACCLAGALFILCPLLENRQTAK
jgi:predicted RND superfamily exporter protein